MESERAVLFLAGATGHTGSRVARRLLADGWRLRCLNHNPENAQYLPQHDALEIIAGDLSRPNEWIDKLRGTEACIHMANIAFAPRVIAACEAAGVQRMIALSSTRRVTRFPDPIARRVIAGETAFESSKLDYTILRSTMIFGYARDNNLEKIVAWLRRRRWMPSVRGWRNRVQPIFVGDLVEAIARTLERPEATRRRALTLAGPEPVTQRELIETIATAMKIKVLWLPVPYWTAIATARCMEMLMKSPPVTRAQIRRTLEDKAFDISEATEALGGWRPSPLPETIALKISGKA